MDLKIDEKEVRDFFSRLTKGYESGTESFRDSIINEMINLNSESKKLGIDFNIKTFYNIECLYE